VTEPSTHTEIDAVYRATVGAALCVIAVSAAGTGQGVSTLALALARRAAAGGRKTLLVELTTRGSAAAERLGAPRRDWSEAPGSAAAAQFDLGDGLTALPAPSLGRPPPLLREKNTLLGLRQSWLERFDLVILDLPPVLSANPHDIDAITAGSVADGVILSVMTRVTREADLIETVAQLRHGGIEILGVVANDRENPSLGDEIARELGRLRRVLPGPVRWLQRWVLSRKLLRRRL
jgi:Mrp family chromosome partitioning ATPase